MIDPLPKSVNTQDRWYLKISRGSSDRVLSTGTQLDMAAKRDALNEQYQTDEYYIEEFDPLKVFTFGDHKGKIDP